jgi:hypothetical protein
MAVLASAMIIFSRTTIALVSEHAVNRENQIASNAAQTFLETLRDENVRLVFARYNADPSDDPGGPGTAPGPRFAVEGLDPGDSPDGLIGEVFYPAIVVSAPGDPVDLELRENIPDAVFGMPRDLDGDAVIDDADHTDDYFVLPLQVRLRWRGRTGDREFRTFATLCQFSWE